MPRTSRLFLCFPVLIANFVLAACSDGVSPLAADDTAADTVSTSAHWNQRAVALVVARQPASNGQAVVSRILTYLSLAQYRAVIAARAAASQPKAPSISAAVSSASAAVLESFFPLDSASTDAQLQTDLTRTPGSSAEILAGTSLGATTGAAVLAQVATDNYLVTAPGAIPTGPDKWVSSTAAIVRSLYGTRPFFLTSQSQLRAPTPPAVGSAPFLTALTEVRQISDTRTAAQTAIALKWNYSSGPFTAGTLNLIADSLIGVNKFGELESARILAFANAATFDAQIACWDSKFTYWFPRPVQEDKAITMAIALPNHPSYPSGHSCMTGAFMGVLSDALPQQKAIFDAMVDEAGLSRVYGGIHYRFDIDAGRDIGRAAAALALAGSLK
jgi:membrane-associated phospholipid phosphatase